MSRIVLITGGSSGYGKAMAKTFKENGDTVIITALGEDMLISTAKEIGADDYMAMDVTRPEDWQKLKKMVMDKYGKIDILINNAGGGAAIKNVEDQTIEEIDKTIKLNLTSVIYGCNTFAKIFREQETGTIINTASVCARQCWPSWSTYAAAKAGVLNFSKGFYLEMQPYNVRVSCIIPSSASTGFQKSCGIAEVNDKLDVQDIADTVFYIANLPQRAVVEDVTVWGIDKQVNPL